MSPERYLLPFQGRSPWSLARSFWRSRGSHRPGPEVFRLSHQFHKELREPVAAASSAYQTWVASELFVLFRCLLSGMVAKAYMYSTAQIQGIKRLRFERSESAD